MITVEEVKAALGKLTLEERSETLSELCGWIDDDWDSQMKVDKDQTFAVLAVVERSPQLSLPTKDTVFASIRG